MNILILYAKELHTDMNNTHHNEGRNKMHESKTIIFGKGIAENNS